MTYKTNPGLVLIRICDAQLIVAKRGQWERVPVVRPIPKKYAFCWTMIEKWETSDEMIRKLAELFQKSVEETEGMFMPAIEYLAKEGYLIPVEDEE